MSIVSPPTTMSSTVRSLSEKITVSVRMIAYTPTFVSRPAKTAVTGAGAVG